MCDNGERQYFVELLSFYFSSLRKKKKKMKKRTHKYFFSVGSPIRLYKSPVSIDYVEIKQRVITRTRCSRDRGLVKRRSFPDLLRKKKKNSVRERTASRTICFKSRTAETQNRSPIIKRVLPLSPIPPQILSQARLRAQLLFITD